MKKIIFTCICCFVLTINLSAQRNERKGYIGLSLGSSFPMGDFKDQDLDNEDAGFAGTGLNLHLLNFGYKFGYTLGVTGSLFGASHPLKFDEDIDIFNDASWSYGGLMGGLLISLPVSEKLDFDLRPMIGFVSGSSPEIKLAGITVLEDQRGSGLCFDLGASLRFNFSDKWCGMIDLDYFSARPTFDNDYKQSISTVNLNIGFGYRLN